MDWVYDTVLARTGQSQIFALKGFSQDDRDERGRPSERYRLEFWGSWGPEEGQQERNAICARCSGGADVDRFWRQATCEWFFGQRLCKMWQDVELGWGAMLK